MPGSSRDVKSRQPWWILTILTLIYSFSWLDRQIIVMLVDPIRQELGLSDMAMSIILGPAFGLCYVAFGIPLGWAADRFDGRVVIMLGLLLWSAATSLTALASSFAMLFAMRLLVAVGEAALTPAAHAMLTGAFPRRQLGTVMAVYSASPKIGTSAAYALGGLLIAAFMSQGAEAVGPFGTLSPWRHVYLFVGLPGFLLAALLFTFRAPDRAERVAQPGSAGIRTFLWQERRLLLPLLAGFCAVSIPSIALQSWVPTYMGRHFGWSPGHYGPIIGLITGVSAFAVVAKGGIMDWLYRRGVTDAPLRFYTWLLAIFTPLAVAAFFLRDPVQFLILYGLVQIVAVPYGLYMATSVQMVTPPHLRAQVSAVALLAGNLLSMMFGPTLAAVLTNLLFGDPASLGWSLAIISGCGMGASWLLLRMALRPFRAMLDAQAEAPAREQAHGWQERSAT